MSDYNFLPASNGSGDTPLMHITGARAIASTVFNVDSVINVPAKFIGTAGTLLSTGFIDPTTKTEFKGHVSGSTLVIDAFEPGSTDTGNTTSQVVIVRPTSGWANRVAQFIMNATGWGTPEAVTFNGITNTGASTISGLTSANGGLKVTNALQLVENTAVTATAPAINSNTCNFYTLTALATAATFAAPTGTPVDGQLLTIRIKDNGTAQTLAWNAVFRAVNCTLPTTTVINRALYVSARYNSQDSVWDTLAVGQY